MNRGDLKTELTIILQDPSIASSYDTWLNQETEQLAYEFDLPGFRLKTPAVLTTNGTDWQYQLADAVHPQGFLFQKKLWKVTNRSFQIGMRIDTDIQIIEELDPTHTDTGDVVQRVAYELESDTDAVLAIWPRAADSLNLWFYRQPIPMETDNDSPEIPAAYHFDVLVPRVVLRAFRLYPEIAESVVGDNTKALQLWTAKYHAGLYGDMNSMGMLDAVRKSRAPRIRGPRAGSGLAGADRYIRWR